MIIWMCAALLTAAVALLIGSPRAGRLQWTDPSLRRGRLMPLVVGGAVLLVVMVAAGGALARWTAFIVAGGELTATVGWLLTRGLAERRGQVNERLVVRACTMIAGQLDAGEIPAQALVTTAQDVPLLAPAAGAVQVGGDVATELQRLARQPGCKGLQWVARGWRLCERTGMPLSPVMRHVADTMRQQGDVRDQRRAELATAKSTGRLLAALPAVGIAMGFFVNADPLTFLANSLPGQVCLVAAATLICVGLIWTNHLAKEEL